jgi:hypothetical protein
MKPYFFVNEQDIIVDKKEFGTSQEAAQYAESLIKIPGDTIKILAGVTIISGYLGVKAFDYASGLMQLDNIKTERLN